MQAAPLRAAGEWRERRFTYTTGGREAGRFSYPMRPAQLRTVRGRAKTRHTHSKS